LQVNQESLYEALKLSEEIIRACPHLALHQINMQAIRIDLQLRASLSNRVCNSTEMFLSRKSVFN